MMSSSNALPTQRHSLPQNPLLARGLFDQAQVTEDPAVPESVSFYPGGEDSEDDILGSSSHAEVNINGTEENKIDASAVKDEQHADDWGPTTTNGTDTTTATTATSFPAKSEEPENGRAKDESDQSPGGSTSSRSQSPSFESPSELVDTKPAAGKKRKKSPPPPPQLILDLPIATDEARASFEEIPENIYQYAKLGRSREAGESMSCDCSFHPGSDDPYMACGDGSDCINRLTQIECLPGNCKCRKYCQNQRFQKRQYADIAVVQTEMKGFGLRAERDLPRDTFIYEYVGDVVSQPSFQKRMREYAEEGIRHFYFMMLQKDEFIDATKRGGLGRFANHSCSPNCYVAKWFIGSHVRMGIFAKRNIKQGEELTFNYNVDRYGHDAQTCYCGEPNCVGFIGGKTQTDIVTVDDLFLDALGITQEQRQELKGNRKKKGKKLDDPDFQPELFPIPAEQMSKVYQGLRQTQSIKVLASLLQRVKLTVDDHTSLRAFLRLRGMSLLTMILEDHSQDAEINLLALECLAIMPLLNIGKVEDSNVRVPVQVLADSENETAKEVAQKLLAYWETLPARKRIAKRSLAEGDASADSVTENLFLKKHKVDEEPAEQKRILASLLQPSLKSSNTVQPAAPVPDERAVGQALHLKTLQRIHTEKDIIERARAEAAAAEAIRLAEAAELKRLAEEKEKKRKERKERHEKAKAEKRRRKNMSAEEKEALKAKKLLKLISPVVVKTCQKYSKDLGVELFKQHAKTLCEQIAEREKKSSSFKEGRLDALTDDKVAKITKYSKDYFVKEVHRFKKAARASGSGLPASSSSSSAFSNATSSTSSPSKLSLQTGDALRSTGRPDSKAANSSTPDSELMNGMMEVSVDDVMGFGAGEDDDMEEDMSVDDSDDDVSVPNSALKGSHPPSDGVAAPSTAMSVEDPQGDSMVGVESPSIDPRKRPPSC